MSAMDRTEEQDDGSVLSLLTEAPYPCSVDELARECQGRRVAENALGRLVRAGLVHRVGDFAWPTRAVLRADAISM